MVRPLILITNDDGITSPGLAAAAAALDPLGDLLIVAPHTQQSGTGRSMPQESTGQLLETTIRANGRTWRAYSAHASPAQAVLHAVLELADRRPALAVSGVNFGENVGMGVMVSGTVGAAMEAAAYGTPALAVSLQVDMSLHINFDNSVDFSVAGHFTRLFAERWLQTTLLPDVDVLKIEIPQSATAETPWRITRLEPERYFIPRPPKRKRLEDEAKIDYVMANPPKSSGSDTDVDALLEEVISVTPLSLDMTSRVDRDDLRKLLDHGC